MVHRSGAAARSPGLFTLGVAALLLTAPALVSTAAAQDVGTVSGRVVDDRGVGVSGAQVFLIQPAISAATGTDGNYALQRVPVGAQTVHVRMLGFSPDSASVTVVSGGTVAQDFTLGRDPLQLQTMVVTGTQTPRTNLDASVAVTTLGVAGGGAGGAAEHHRDAALRAGLHPGRELGRRGEPEHLDARHSRRRVRDVHGRRDAGVPHHAHLLHERRQPVPLRRRTSSGWRSCGAAPRRCSAPTRRARSSTSSTRPAAISSPARCGPPRAPRRSPATTSTPAVRWATTGGSTWAASTATTTACATPGSPGIRGGQLKANVTRRPRATATSGASVKYIDDRNQFILPLPFTNPDDPEYVQRLQRLRRDEHATRASTSGCPTPDRRAARCRSTTGSGPRRPGSRSTRPSTCRTTGTSRTPRR